MSLVVVVVSAMGVVAARVEPTGVTLADLCWAAAAGAVVAAAASRAAPWTVIAHAAVAGVLSGGWVQVAAWSSLAVALVPVVRRPVPVLGAISGALGVNVLVRAEAFGPSLWTAVLAVVAAALVVASGVSSLSEPHRRQVTRAARAATVAVLVAVASAGTTMLAVRGDLEAGVVDARQGIELANLGEVERAQERFERARGRLERSNGLLGGFWMAPARVLPVVGPNIRATNELAATGVEVAHAAITVADSADPSRLRVGDGSIDLDRLSETAVSLDRALAAIDRALVTVERVRSPWLVAPLVARIDSLEAMLVDAAEPARDLMVVAETAPAMLGADGPRTYLILLTAPSETRGLGGFVGNYGILLADRGRLDLRTVGRPDELWGQGRRTLDGPGDYLARYYRYVPELWVKNVTASPDFPTVAEVATELFAQSRVGGIDGVIVADPTAIAALLTVTGAVEVAGLPYALDRDTVEHYLHTDQYFVFPNPFRRHEVLEELMRVTFGSLTGGGDLNPRDLIDSFAPVVAERRLLVWSRHEPDRALIDQVGLAGRFPRPGEVGDLISVRSANTNGNKIDVFLERDIAYTVDFHPDRLTARVGITLTSSAVDDPTWPDYVVGNVIEGLPRAWNYQWVSIYTPHAMTALRIEGPLVDDETHEHIEELGWNVYSVYVKIPPQGSVTITVDLEGPPADAASYHLLWSAQPTIHPDRVRLVVREDGRTVEAIEEVTSADLELGARAHGRQR